jgi:hypothetical protein
MDWSQALHRSTGHDPPGNRILLRIALRVWNYDYAVLPRAMDLFPKYMDLGLVEQYLRPAVKNRVITVIYPALETSVADIGNK